MKVSNIQKGLLVRTMICAVSLAAACFFEASLNVQAAPRAQETGERVTVVIDPGHGGDNEGTLEGITKEKEMTMVTALAMYEELTISMSCNHIIMMPGSKGLSPHELAHRWVKDLRTRPDMSIKVG